MVGCMLLIVSDCLELLVVGYDLGEAHYHGNLCHRNRADSARHSAVVGGAGRALCLPVGGRRPARVGGLPHVLLGQRTDSGRRLGRDLRRTVAGMGAPELLNEGPTEWLALGFTLSYTLAGLGAILFGVATIRARVFPEVAAILLINGVVPVAVLRFVPLPLPVVLLGVAVAWLGLALFRVGGEGARQATPRVR